MDLETHADIPLTDERRAVQVLAMLATASPVLAIALWSMMLL